MQRRTRIVATLGPATDRPGVLEQLLQGGLDVARINFSHGTPAEHRARIGRLRELARQSGRAVAVLADLPGPKLRALLAAPLRLEVGSRRTLARHDAASADIGLTEPEALARVQRGQRVLLDDGRLQGRIVDVIHEHAVFSVEVGGTLLPNKGVNLPDTDLDIPAVTQRDRDAVAVALEAGVDWLALSFVRSAAAADALREVVTGLGGNVPVLAKMERPEAVRHAAEIVAAFDGIMVARGDLGVEIPLEQVPHVQKQLIRQARLAGKPVITATDMLDSMRSNPRPTRAEASDVANAVYDGTDAVMLSGETAVGDYPVEALACMDRIACAAEGHWLHGTAPEDAPRLLDCPRGTLIEQLTQMLCTLAQEVGARAIITPTITGRTPCLVARHRPPQSIVAVASSESVVRRLSVVWGVQALALTGVAPGADRLMRAVEAACRGGAVAVGELVLVLAAHPIEGGPGFPTVRVVRVGPDGVPAEP